MNLHGKDFSLKSFQDILVGMSSKQSNISLECKEEAEAGVIISELSECR